MFISNGKPVSNPSKMPSYINLFLKTELTCIPKILTKYLGNYYDNALCNGATWVFALWCILHMIFDKFIEALLKKMRYREYVRLRLKNSLWYLGFYSTALIYCGATLAQNEVELFNFKRMHVPSSNTLPIQVTLGYTLISTFYLHSALWEGLTKECFLSMFSYLFLFFFLVSSYILRIVEISFTLTALIGVAQVAVEFTRCCLMSTTQDTLLSKLILGLLYMVTFAVYVALHIIVIPLTFVVPLGLKIMADYPNIILLFLFFNLVSWLVTEIYQSVLFKCVDHWLYHEGEIDSENIRRCSNGFFECSLFKPRDDISYNLQILRQEIKDRETKMMSLRKPKNKSMLMQTLKCMVAIKRRLSERRAADSSDSDDSEKSEDGDLKARENTDDETKALQSDREEESDDEESESQDSVVTTKGNNGNNNKRNESNVCDAKCVKDSGDEKIDLAKPGNSENVGDPKKFAIEIKEDIQIATKLPVVVPAEEKTDVVSSKEDNTIVSLDGNSCIDTLRQN